MLFELDIQFSLRNLGVNDNTAGVGEEGPRMNVDGRCSDGGRHPSGVECGCRTIPCPLHYVYPPVLFDRGLTPAARCLEVVCHQVTGAGVVLRQV